MSTNVLCVAIIFVLLFLPHLNDATARNFPYSGPSTTLYAETKTGGGGGGGYVTMKPPRLHHRKELPFGGEIRNCMPKGFSHSSAPSRYVNLQPFGSSPCFTRKHSKHP
ncbi:hypothetical protein ACH5RR_009850 [Cinchona calisaya]|uniref:Transmembrane protein n=1 Tax=Cinchona calisaya TaxID=153742 RepID=A0ABD3AH54_9GENT